MVSFDYNGQFYITFVAYFAAWQFFAGMDITYVIFTKDKKHMSQSHMPASLHLTTKRC